MPGRRETPAEEEEGCVIDGGKAPALGVIEKGSFRSKRVFSA